MFKNFFSISNASHHVERQLSKTLSHPSYIVIIKLVYHNYIVVNNAFTNYFVLGTLYQLGKAKAVNFELNKDFIAQFIELRLLSFNWTIY
jgi:hypothetical protein